MPPNVFLQQYRQKDYAVKKEESQGAYKHPINAKKLAITTRKLTANPKVKFF